MRFFRWALVGLIVLAPLGSADAETADTPPASLDELLERVRVGNQNESAESARRVEEFRAAKTQQERLLTQALAAKAAREQESAGLEARFEANEGKIPELEETLHNRQGTLGELFGVVRQVAGDTRAEVQTALTSAQLSGRTEFLGKLAQSRQMPSIDDLEKLWFTLQQEMTESGKVVRFPATVIAVGGGESERQVVRVGSFNAVADGKYLQYLSESGKLAELGRQPARRHLSTVSDLEAAKSGLVGFSLDPSRGSLLSLLIQTPDIEERVEQGGVIGYVIIVLGLLGLALALYRLIYLAIVGRKIKAQIGEDDASPGNPLGRILAVYQQYRTAAVETLELKLDEGIMKEIPKIERGATMIKVLSVVAPLLGLLGTVTGMIKTFQAITLFGTGDPKLMAGGISEALVTTVLGLVMAIPLTLVHSVVSSRGKELIQILDEQSTGIIAAHAEATEAEQGASRAAAG